MPLPRDRAEEMRSASHRRAERSLRVVRGGAGLRHYSPPSGHRGRLASDLAACGEAVGTMNWRCWLFGHRWTAWGTARSPGWPWPLNYRHCVRCRIYDGPSWLPIPSEFSGRYRHADAAPKEFT